MLIEQIKIEKGKIVDHCFSSNRKEGYFEKKGFRSSPFGYDLKFYDNDFNPLDESVVYGQKLSETPKGFVFENGSLRELSQVEKIQQGLEEVPFGEVLENGQLRDKTLREKLDSGEMTIESYCEMFRYNRDMKLCETDKYMLSDFPISEPDRQRVKEYRQYLRDIPNDPDFPFVEIKDFEI